MNNKRNILIIILACIIVGIIAYILLFANKIEIKSISLKNNFINLIVGNVDKLEVNIVPDNASLDSVIWESSNPNIVFVTSDGIVEARSAGTAIITVKTKNEKAFDKCMVNVLSEDADELYFKEKSIDLRVNDSRSLDIVIVPSELSDEIIWKSSDPNIVQVDSGIITGKKRGKASVKAIYGSKEAIIDVMVVIPTENIQMKENDIVVNVGNTSEIKVITEPTEVLNTEIKWESSNEEIAKVENGTIFGVKEGNATIKATYDGKIAVCNVKVVIPVSEIKLDKTSLILDKGKSETLLTTLTPSSIMNRTITWTSSDESVAQVSAGKVTGIKAGTATITATIDGKVANCEVTVIGYYITSDAKFSSFDKVAEYSSEKLKYKIIKDEKWNYYTIVWVLNANKQLNSALPQLGKVFAAENILSNEIKNYGYSNKGLVATNASYFWDGWGDNPCLPFVINKGNILLDIQNIDYNKRMYGTLGVDKNGELKTYEFSKNDYAKNMSSKKKMIDDGIRNDFAYTITIIDSNGNITNSNSSNTRTIICQVDINNFVLYSGSSLTFARIGQELKNTYNCQTAYNLDGGGSSKLYYKTANMSSAKKLFGGDRNIPDMLYFSE